MVFVFVAILMAIAFGVLAFFKFRNRPHFAEEIEQRKKLMDLLKSSKDVLSRLKNKQKLAAILKKHSKSMKEVKKEFEKDLKKVIELLKNARADVLASTRGWENHFKKMDGICNKYAGGPSYGQSLYTINRIAVPILKIFVRGDNKFDIAKWFDDMVDFLEKHAF